jgi:hypothetical protein
MRHRVKLQLVHAVPDSTEKRIIGPYNGLVKHRAFLLRRISMQLARCEWRFLVMTGISDRRKADFQPALTY